MAPMINIPRSELEGPQVDPGTYPARIDKVTKKVSSNNNDMLYVHWTVTGTEPPAGIKVLDQITLVPEAYWKLTQLFACLRYTPGEMGFMTEDLISRECKIIVFEDEYGGVKRAKVNGYLPL